MTTSLQWKLTNAIIAIEILMMKSQKAIEERFGWKFIRINPNDNSYISMVMNIIRSQIKKSSKRSLIDRILEKLLGLQFKSNQ